MLEFLGFGLIRPFRRDGRADLLAAGGEQVIRSAVGQILGTVGASDGTLGELPWRTDFGSLLYRLRHQRNDSVLQELARVYVVDALKRWEPRISVTAVAVRREQHNGENVLALRLRYDVISTNTPGNNVILSGIDHTVHVQLSPLAKVPEQPEPDAPRPESTRLRRRGGFHRPRRDLEARDSPPPPWQPDPVWTDWRRTIEWNALPPRPFTCLVRLLQAELDPLAKTDGQARMFARLGTSDPQ